MRMPSVFIMCDSVAILAQGVGFEVGTYVIRWTCELLQLLFIGTHCSYEAQDGIAAGSEHLQTRDAMNDADYHAFASGIVRNFSKGQRDAAAAA